MRASSEGAFFIVQQPARKSQPWAGFFNCCWQVPACGEREATIVALPAACDSAVAPASMAVQSSSVGIPCCRFPPSCSPVRLPTAKSSSRSGPVLQCPRTSSQPTCTPVNTRPSLGHVGLWYGPSVCFSLRPICHRSAASSSSNSLKCFPSVPVDFPDRKGVSPNSGISPLLQLPYPGVQVPSHFLSSSFSLLFFRPTQLCRDLYSPFWCPRSSASFQLVFSIRENCCICRCIPDASVERDELHIYLLLRHLESPQNKMYILNSLSPHHKILCLWAQLLENYYFLFVMAYFLDLSCSL